MLNGHLQIGVVKLNDELGRQYRFWRRGDSPILPYCLCIERRLGPFWYQENFGIDDIGVEGVSQGSGVPVLRCMLARIKVS
jgi:hypothetical protein